MFKRKKYFLYAAGVSNSNNKDLELFKKDFLRLKKTKNQFGDLTIIYISSCSVLDSSRKNSLYLKKKIKNENFVKKNFKKFLIIRIPEIIGKNKNKNTLINFIYYKILNNKKFVLFKNARRNFIKIEDVVDILTEIVSNNISNKIINIASNKMTSPSKIVNIFEKILRKKAKLIIKNNKFKNFNIDIRYVKNLKTFKKIKFNDNYLSNSLWNYINGNI